MVKLTHHHFTSDVKKKKKKDNIYLLFLKSFLFPVNKNDEMFYFLFRAPLITFYPSPFTPHLPLSDAPVVVKNYVFHFPLEGRPKPGTTRMNFWLTSLRRFYTSQVVMRRWVNTLYCGNDQTC